MELVQLTTKSGTPRKPNWLRVKAPGGKNYAGVRQMMRELDLNTVC